LLCVVLREELRWEGVENKGSGQLVQKPAMRAFESYTRRSVIVSLTAA
jgi:hypothetical protein